MADSVNTVGAGFNETQIGLIPEDWDTDVIAGVIDETISGDWGRDTNDGHPDWIRCQIIRGTDFPNVATGQLDKVPERYVRPSSAEKRQLGPDDLLVEISGGSKYQPTGRILQMTPGALANAHVPLLFTNFVKRYRVDQSRVATSFFHLFWEYLYSIGRTRVYEKRTTGIRNFKHKEFLSNEIIAFPPLPEQRRIADVLSTIQRAIEAQDKVIAAAKELKRSLMQRLFTYGPGQDPAPTKETEIGEIPEHWGVARLADIAQTYSGSTPSRKNDAYWQPGQVPWLKSGELQDGLVDDVEEFISEEALRETAVKFVQPGTLLVAMYGATAGKVGYSTIGTTINQAICAVVPRNEVFNSRFFFYWFAHTRSSLLSKRFGGAQPNLNQQIIKDLVVPLPLRDEQEAIANTLSAVDAKTTAEERRKAALQELLTSMLQQLMTGQLRVKDIEVAGDAPH